MPVYHRREATLPDEVGAEVNANEWNESHDASTMTLSDAPLLASGLVPYTDAITDVDLGSNSIVAESVISAGMTAVGTNLTFVNDWFFDLAMDVDRISTEGKSIARILPDAAGYVIRSASEIARQNDLLIIFNIASYEAKPSYRFTLTHNDPSATGSVFWLPMNRDLDLWPQESAAFIYDPVLRTWNYIGKYTPKMNGSDNEIAFRSGDDIDGAALSKIDADGHINIVENAAATTPASGLTLLARQNAGRLLEHRDAAGQDLRYQPFTVEERIRQWLPQPSAAALNLGITMSFTGSQSNPAVAGTNFFISQMQVHGTGAAAAGNASGGRGGAVSVFRGNGTNRGGFRFAGYGGGNDAAAVANARNFYGLYGVAGFIGNVNPSTLTNILGFGWDTGDANMQFMHNDAAGAATKVDLGAGFPANTNGVDWYLHEIWCAPNASEVQYKLTRWGSAGAETSIYGVATTDLPAGSTFLAPQIYYGNGTTALTRRYAIGAIYLGAMN